MLHQMRRPWPPPSATSTSFLLRLFLLISILVSLLPPSSCDHEEYASNGYEECRKRPFSCGSKKINVSYPLYDDKSHPYCGYPGFELRCDPQNADVEIEIDGKWYSLVNDEIDYDHFYLTIVDRNFVGKSCPQPDSDTHFGPFLFSYMVVNVTIWKCSGPILKLLDLQCSSNPFNSQHMYFWPNNSLPIDVEELTASCRTTGEVWMDKTALDQMIARKISYEEALQKGFTMTWATEVWQNCGECIRSDGVCGSNDSSQVCFYGDLSGAPQGAPHRGAPRDPSGAPQGAPPRDPSGAPSPRGHRYKERIIVGVCAGAGGLILVCLVGVLFYLWRKRVRRSGGLLSQTTSSLDASSKKDTEIFSDQVPNTQIFQYEELHEATDGFSTAKELGDGGFGTVYKGNLADGRTVAIKRLYENNYRRVEQFRTEVSILSSLRHPNLVSLYGCTSRHSRELILVYQYVPNGTVADHLHGPRASRDGLPWPIRMSIAIETAKALSFLHSVSPQIIHRDVKTNNILLDNHFHVKVADFGLSRLFPLNATHVSTAPQGTPGYVDPEYHECYQLTDKSDVYSFGVVLVELISSQPAVDITRPRHEINLASLALSKIQSDQLDQLVDPKLWHQANGEVVWMVNHVAELAFRCLQEDGEMRPTMREVADALRAIDGEASGRAKDATAHVGVNDDECQLQSTRPQSPETVTTKWSSTSTKTTPKSSG